MQWREIKYLLLVVAITVKLKLDGKMSCTDDFRYSDSIVVDLCSYIRHVTLYVDLELVFVNNKRLIWIVHGIDESVLVDQTVC